MKYLSLITLILFTTMSTAQELPKLIRKTADFEIDGKGSAKEWEATGWMEIAQRTSNGPSLKTQAKVLYSDKGHVLPG